MALSNEEIRLLSDQVADEVIQRIHRYPDSYQDPHTIIDGLRESMSEELTAADWYRRRAADADKKGDSKTASLYRKIADDEENEHYADFNQRLAEIEYNRYEKITSVKE